MPKSVISSLFTVYSSKKSVNRQPSTVNRNGFTLVELLIVIVVIALLVGIGSFAYTTAQAKARDSRRKQDLEAIKAALELARQDASGVYPSTLSGISSSYLKVLPKDPKTGADYIYTPQPTSCTTACTSYFLQTTLENSNDTAIGSSQTNCAGAPSGSYYVVCPAK